MMMTKQATIMVRWKLRRWCWNKKKQASIRRNMKKKPDKGLNLNQGMETTSNNQEVWKINTIIVWCLKILTQIKTVKFFKEERHCLRNTIAYGHVTCVDLLQLRRVILLNTWRNTWRAWSFPATFVENC